VVRVGRVGQCGSRQELRRNKEGEQGRAESREQSKTGTNRNGMNVQLQLRQPGERRTKLTGRSGTGATDVRLSRIVSTTKGCCSSSSSSSSVMAEESKSKMVVAVGRPKRRRDGENGSSKQKREVIASANSRSSAY